MTVWLHPPDPRQESGFYSFLFAALRRHAGAQLARGPRPLPRLEQPRQHESVWIEWDGVMILMDMSDHVFLFDLPALERCDLYFKANLNPALARKILARAGLETHAAKLRPYLFLPPTLAGCAWLERGLRPLRRRNGRPFDFCHVVGVYENPFLAGTPPEAFRNVAADPQISHFWARCQMQRALQASGMKGICRLTNRGNPDLLDAGGVVRANLDPRLFMLAIAASRVAVLNTLPHAVLPWKAMESIALGVPFVVERRPLAAMPPELELVPGRHYLELLPELPGFDETADPDDIRAYRLFPEIRLDRLRERAEWLRDEIRNRERMAEMRAEVDAYRRRVLAPAAIVRHLAETVARAAGKENEA